MVTTREAAPAVRLNADWQDKYRQRAEQFLLVADHLHHNHQAELHSESPHLPQQQQNSIAGDCNLHVQKTQLHYQQETIVAGDGELHLQKLHLQQVATAGDGEQESVSGNDELHHHQQNQDAILGNGELLSLCVVGRSGVGKGSLINHLLQERAARVSSFESDFQERIFDYHGLFCIREIPGYDGWHSIDSPSRHERLFRHFHHSSHGSHSHSHSHSRSRSRSRSRSHSHSHSHGSKSHTSHSNHSSNSSHSSTHGSHSSHSSTHGSHSSHSSGHGSSNGKGRKLNLDEFVQTYGLFEAETKAIIFVVNSKITPDDQKLMELAVENRKFFCIVCTHADDLVQIADSALLKRQLEELEEQLRRDLSLIQSLNVRIFILSIPFPEGQATGAMLEGHDLQCVMKNIQNLHFPLLKAYLSEPRGLLDELQIHGFVKEEVWKVLEPFQNVKKRHQALDFSQHFVAGTLLPVVGPVMVSFAKTLCYTLKACSEVGLIEDADDAMKKVTADANKHGLSVKVASREGLVTAVHDSMIHIFGKVVFEIAIAEVVSTAAESALSGALPLVGPAISAAHLPSRFKKIAEKLGIKASMLHELWIMQNITGLMGKTK